MISILRCVLDMDNLPNFPVTDGIHSLGRFSVVLARNASVLRLTIHRNSYITNCKSSLVNKCETALQLEPSAEKIRQTVSNLVNQMETLGGNYDPDVEPQTQTDAEVASPPKHLLNKKAGLAKPAAGKVKIMQRARQEKLTAEDVAGRRANTAESTSKPAASKIRDAKTNPPPQSRGNAGGEVNPKHTRSRKDGKVGNKPVAMTPEETVEFCQEHYICPLKTANPRFPKAVYFCRICDNHFDDIQAVKKHTLRTEHQRLKDCKEMTDLLISIPPPATTHCVSLGSAIRKIAAESGGDAMLRRDKAHEIAAALSELVGKAVDESCSVRPYGSVETGLGLASANVNLELVYSDANINHAHALIQAADCLVKAHFKKIVRDFTHRWPYVSFRVSGWPYICNLSVRNKHAYNAGQLLRTYADVFPAFRILGNALRYWANVSTVADFDGGGYHPYVLDLMMCHYLQQTGYLPVLHELGDKKYCQTSPADYEKDMSVIKENFKFDAVTDSLLGKLWIGFFRFYTVEKDHSASVINVRQLAPLSRESKNWNKKRFAVEDPFIFAKNIANVSQQFFDYFQAALQRSYKYFGIPRTAEGPLFAYNCRKLSLCDDVVKKIRAKYTISRTHSDDPKLHISLDRELATVEPSDLNSVKPICSAPVVAGSGGGTGSNSGTNGATPNTSKGFWAKWTIDNLDNSGTSPEIETDDAHKCVHNDSAGHEDSSDDANCDSFQVEDYSLNTQLRNLGVSDPNNRIEEDNDDSFNPVIDNQISNESGTMEREMDNGTAVDLDIAQDDGSSSFANLDDSVQQLLLDESNEIDDSFLLAEEEEVEIDLDETDQPEAEEDGSEQIHEAANHVKRPLHADVLNLGETFEGDSLSPEQYNEERALLNVRTLLREMIDRIVSNAEACRISEDPEMQAALALLKMEDYSYELSRFNCVGNRKQLIVCSVCQRQNHKGDRCPEMQFPRMTSLPPFQAEYAGIMNQFLVDVARCYRQTEANTATRAQFRAELQAAMRNVWPDAVLTVFGSSCNGFGFNTSDMDICLVFEAMAECPAEEEQIKIIKKVARTLRRISGFTSIHAVTKAKVPIVKFYNKFYRFEGDVSLYNTLAIRNTRLLQLYSVLDERVKVLGYVVKLFAKSCDIGDASKGSLSSYAYMLMLIFFLQQTEPPVLPVLQEIGRPENTDQYVVEGWDTYFCEDVALIGQSFKVRNTQSVLELWVDFLTYYAYKFQCAERVVCIRKLAPLTKFEKLWTDRMLAVEDPFLLTHNLGNGLSKRMFLYIARALGRARTVFGTSLSNQQFLNYFGPRLNYQSLEHYFFVYSLQEEAAKHPPPRDGNCHLCGSVGHFVENCPIRRGNKHPDEVSSESSSDEAELPKGITIGKPMATQKDCSPPIDPPLTQESLDQNCNNDFSQENSADISTSTPCSRQKASPPPSGRTLLAALGLPSGHRRTICIESGPSLTGGHRISENDNTVSSGSVLSRMQPAATAAAASRDFVTKNDSNSPRPIVGGQEVIGADRGIGGDGFGNWGPSNKNAKRNRGGKQNRSFVNRSIVKDSWNTNTRIAKNAHAPAARNPDGQRLVFNCPVGTRLLRDDIEAQVDKANRFQTTIVHKGEHFYPQANPGNSGYGAGGSGSISEQSSSLPNSSGFGGHHSGGFNIWQPGYNARQTGDDWPSIGQQSGNKMNGGRVNHDSGVQIAPHGVAGSGAPGRTFSYPPTSTSPAGNAASAERDGKRQQQPDRKWTAGDRDGFRQASKSSFPTRYSLCESSTMEGYPGKGNSSPYGPPGIAVAGADLLPKAPPKKEWHRKKPRNKPRAKGTTDSVVR